MERLIRLSAAWTFIAIMSCANYCWGQLVSKETEYPETRGNHVLLRTVEIPKASFIYYQLDNENQFIYTVHELNPIANPYKFILPTLTVVPNMEILYTINDMHIEGKKCICCGVMKTPIGETQIEDPTTEPGREIIYESSGFIGWIDLDNINVINPYIRIKMAKVEGTTDLRKLDVKPNGGDTLVALTGTIDRSGHPSCLVSMNKNGSSVDYNVYVIDNTLEHLSDVAFTEEMVVTVSSVYDEHYSFVLRGGGINDLFDFSSPNISDYKVMHTFKTDNCGCYNTWHRNDVEMKLVGGDSKNLVTVGYETYDIGENMKYTALFQIVIYGSIYSKQTAHSYPMYSESGETLADMVYYPKFDMIMLLNHYRTNPNIPSSYTNVYLPSGSYKRLFFNDRVYVSMDFPKDGNDSVRIGGADYNSETICQLLQDFVHEDVSHNLESCYSGENGNTCEMESPEIVETSTEITTIHPDPFIWKTYIINAETCQKENTCTHYYETK
ncbi:MAG: hypothetical protein J6X88_08250 [Bacteroidales bacterium]|nr:hypothetical protein [Bacteroidales bacterium]